MSREAAVTEASPSPKADVFDINSGGKVKPFVYKADETILQVIEQAIREFHLPARAHQLGLFKSASATDPLNPNATLKSAGVHPGDKLILKPIVVEGGEE